MGSGLLTIPALQKGLRAASGDARGQAKAPTPGGCLVPGGSHSRESYRSRAGDLDRASVGGLWAACRMAPVHSYSAKTLEIHSREIKAATSTHKAEKELQVGGTMSRTPPLCPGVLVKLPEGPGNLTSPVRRLPSPALARWGAMPSAPLEFRV